MKYDQSCKHLFRIWDEKEKQFCSSDNLFVYDIHGTKEINVLAKGFDKTLEQCIGIRDKNGKPIFENDLVLFTRNVINTMSTDYTFLCLVKFDTQHGGRYILVDPESELFENGRYSQIISYNTKAELIVVGNIHENKELIRLGKEKGNVL